MPVSYCHLIGVDDPALHSVGWGIEKFVQTILGLVISHRNYPDKTGEACVSAEICVGAVHSCVQSPVFQKFDKNNIERVRLNEILISIKDINATKYQKYYHKGSKYGRIHRERCIVLNGRIQTQNLLLDL